MVGLVEGLPGAPQEEGVMLWFFPGVDVLGQPEATKGKAQLLSALRD